MEWNGKWNGNFGMEDARMEWKISRMVWNTIFHTSIPSILDFVHFLQKNTYRCRVVIKNIVTEIFNLSIYAYYLSTNCGTWVVYIAKTVYLLHHCKYIAVCSINVIVHDFDRFDFFFEIEYLPSPKFCFFTSSQKLVFAISFPFQLNFIYILVFQLTIILFGVKAWYFYNGKCCLAVWL